MEDVNFNFYNYQTPLYTGRTIPTKFLSRGDISYF